MPLDRPFQTPLRLAVGLLMTSFSMLWIACRGAQEVDSVTGERSVQGTSGRSTSGRSTSSQGAGPRGTDDGADAAVWFEERGAALGIDFQHRMGFDGSFFMPEIIGPGVALFDADGDGRLDVLAINGRDHNVAAGDNPRSEDDTASRGDRLYLQTADGRFVDRTEGSGLGDGYGMGCAVGDIDNDGDLDLYVTRFGTDALYRNRGDGTFEDVSASAGAAVEGWSTSAGFFDHDGDGWLDLYVVRYVAYDATRQCSTLAGQRDYCGPLSFRGMSDVLLANRGDGTFEDVSAAAGIGRAPGRGLGLALEDFDDDGRPDIYVANDGENNTLWHNLGDGRFEDRAVVSGVAVNLLGHREASMGVSVGDVDGDGELDIFLTHLGQETNTLYLGTGNGTFEDRVAASGLGSSSLPYTGFGTGLFDGDLDGDLDLLVANGKVRLIGDEKQLDTVSQEAPLRRYDEVDALYVNLGDGTFAPHPSPGPLAEGTISRGLAVGDVDNDGDLDAVISTVGGPLRVLLNKAPRRGHYLALRLLDPELRRQAIGAKLWLQHGTRRQLRTVGRTTSYLSSQPATVHLGVDSTDAALRVTVRWPAGDDEDFELPGVDRLITLLRGQGTPAGPASTDEDL